VGLKLSANSIYIGSKGCYTAGMTTIKTAVSIEESLFRRVEEVAGEMQVPRSRIFSMALESYIQRYETQKLIEILNEVYANGLTEEEKEDMEAMKYLQAELLEDEQW
jgi:metal-responsive CopG/Arc/MetJ family transcriptional regulator